MRCFLALTLTTLLPLTLALHPALPFKTAISLRSLAKRDTCTDNGYVDCGVDDCMPVTGVCCDSNGDYCDIGDYCITCGCCPLGQNCEIGDCAVSTVTTFTYTATTSASVTNGGTVLAATIASSLAAASGTVQPNSTGAPPLAATPSSWLGGSGPQCETGYIECGEGCLPLGYTCCPDGSGGCETSSQYCVPDPIVQGMYGCCNVGDTCPNGGDGGGSAPTSAQATFPITGAGPAPTAASPPATIAPGTGSGSTPQTTVVKGGAADLVRAGGMQAVVAGGLAAIGALL